MSQFRLQSNRVMNFSRAILTRFFFFFHRRVLWSEMVIQFVNFEETDWNVFQVRNKNEGSYKSVHNKVDWILTNFQTEILDFILVGLDSEKLSTHNFIFVTHTFKNLLEKVINRLVKNSKTLLCSRIIPNSTFAYFPSKTKST